MGADIDYRDGQDLTALHHAVLSGFEDVTELLLSRGADVNAPSTTAGLPLCLAVLKDRSHIVRLLLDKFRAAINLADHELGTPLHCAALTNNCEIARVLLEHGAASDSRNRLSLPKLASYQVSISIGVPDTNNPWSSELHWTSITPLMIAVLANNIGLAKLLFAVDETKQPSASSIPTHADHSTISMQ
jgi:ankyrin repeat protein